MEITKVDEPIIAVRISQYPEDKKNEFLCLGRSNVGKSSFISAIYFSLFGQAPGNKINLPSLVNNPKFFLKLICFNSIPLLA